MSDEYKDPATETTEAGATAESGSADSWKEVGAQLQALGAGLASAFSTAWKSEENKRHLKEMRSGLEAVVNELGAVIKEATRSPEAQQVKTEAEKTLETVKSAGERTVQEVKPKLASTLASANEELQKLLARMRKQEAAEAEKTAEAGAAETAAAESDSAEQQS